MIQEKIINELIKKYEKDLKKRAQEKLMSVKEYTKRYIKENANNKAKITELLKNNDRKAFQKFLKKIEAKVDTTSDENRNTSTPFREKKQANIQKEENLANKLIENYKDTLETYAEKENLDINTFTKFFVKKATILPGEEFLEELIKYKNEENCKSILEIVQKISEKGYYNKYNIPSKENTLAIEKYQGIEDNKEKNEKPDLSGLDKIVSDETLETTQTLNEKIPPTAKKGKRKKAAINLIKKFKEKMEDPKFRKKFIIGAIATTGIIVIAGAAIATALSGDASHINNTQQLVNNIDSSQIGDVIKNISSIDYSQIGEGNTVFTNAMDAASNTHGLIANEWFESNPLDVFNTQTGQYMNLTHAQLNDINFMTELANDPNNAILFGNSIDDPSGFMQLSDVISETTKGMTR